LPNAWFALAHVSVKHAMGKGATNMVKGIWVALCAGSFVQIASSATVPANAAIATEVQGIVPSVHLTGHAGVEILGSFSQTGQPKKFENASKATLCARCWVSGVSQRYGPRIRHPLI